MNGEQRRTLISRQLNGNAGVSTAQLQKILGVSPMTIWRDLGVLEEAGVLKRVHGGAVALDPSSGPEPSFAVKSTVSALAKQQIARVAVDKFVKPRMVISLEGGTSVAAVMPFLPTDADLTILTNSLEIVRQCPRGLAVLCSGGLYRDVSGTFVGPQAVKFFRDHHADIAFISATAVDASFGLMDPNPLEIEVKQTLCGSAKQVVVLCDHTKLGKLSTLPVLPLKSVGTMVTDAAPPRLMNQALKAAGVKVLRV